MATDTQQTNTETGDILSDEVTKSLKFVCQDGQAVMSITTNLAYIDDALITDWLTDTLAGFKLSCIPFDDVVSDLVKKLEGEYNRYNITPKLTALLLGWKENESRCPIGLIITNADKITATDKRHAVKFNIRPINISQNKVGVEVRGSISATKNSSCNAIMKQIVHLLNINSNKLNENIMANIARYIITASQNDSGSTIGENVVISLITRGKEYNSVRVYPDTPDKVYPNHSTDKISITGLRVINDFVEGGETIIGNGF